MHRQTTALSLVLLIVLQLTLPALALPSLRGEESARKFAVKPNQNKKVISEVNEIAKPAESGFSFINLLNSIMQLFLGGSGVDKSDSVQGGFSWKSVVSFGLHMVLAGLNRNAAEKSDSQTASSSIQGILAQLLSSFLGQDKGDVSAMAKTATTLIQIISNLMDALKMSFSQRSSNARSLGSKDPLSDAAVAATTIFKGYINTHKTQDEVCMQRIMCEANRECSQDSPDSGYLFCQLGTYAAGYMLEKSSFTPLDAFTTAGRNGRTGEDCAQIYQECNDL